MTEEQAYQQGAADFENGVKSWSVPVTVGDYAAAYRKGWNNAESYASEASLRAAESGAAYEAWLDARSRDADYYRQDAYERFLEGLACEFGTEGERDPEADYERDPFMARVLAYGEDARRASDAAWKAGEPERRAELERQRQRAQAEIPF